MVGIVLSLILTTNVTFHLPNLQNDFKGFMDYKKIQDKESAQHQLQSVACTDDDGIRYITHNNIKYLCVALGSYFGTKIGTIYEIKLGDGKIFNVVLADCKSDKDTDITNTYLEINDSYINIIEFVVDVAKISEKSLKLGDIIEYPYQIKSIVKQGYFDYLKNNS